MLRVKNVAETLGISVACVYDLVAKGLIPCYKVGVRNGAIRFKDEDVQAYLETCRVEGEQIARPQLKHIRLP